MIETGYEDGCFVVTAPGYRLLVRESTFERSPYARLTDADGHVWTDLHLLSSLHTTATPDEIVRVHPLRIEREDEAVVLTARVESTAWTEHETRLVCTPEGVELEARVVGSGALTDVTLLGSRGTLTSGAAGAFRSSIRFRGVFVPAPGEPVQFVRPAATSAVLGVVGDADPGRLNAIFSPPPLALAFGKEPPAWATTVPEGEWLGLWLRASVAESTFTGLRYSAVDGGYLLQLDYEGHTLVEGSFSTPVIVLRPVAQAWDVLDAYRADLVDRGFAPARGPVVPDWWLEPIFCGWGAQCARAAHLMHPGSDEPTSGTAPEAPGEEPLVVRAAPSLARQDVYDEFLARLAQHDLDPGTIVLDDRWQAEYGTGAVDPEHWPDLKAWIADRHAEGRKVLLWWKAWDPQGLPVEDCVVDAAGKPVTVDPANPTYLRRLESIVHYLLSPEGLDADGFKVDFTQRGPSGQTLKGVPGVWGFAGLHALLHALHSAAHETKPDALVICHTVHPSFADVADMIRLNDVSKRDVNGVRVPVVEQLAVRHEIARRVLPHHPIDTDQWPMPNRDQWLAYVDAQIARGVPALYYLEAIDRSGEPVSSDDLHRVADSWRRYRGALRE